MKMLNFAKNSKDSTNVRKELSQMNHIKALFIKFLLCLAVVWLVLGVYYNIDFGHVLSLSIILTVTSYIIGDLYLLERIENWGATIADLLLAVFVVWLYSINFIDENFSVLSAAGLVGLFLAAGEWFFHKYVDKHILHYRRYSDLELHDINLMTEISDEFDGKENRDDKR